MELTFFYVTAELMTLRSINRLINGTGLDYQPGNLSLTPVEENYLFFYFIFITNLTEKF